MSLPPPPSTRDIARITGVSHVTVARVLNNQGGVSENTRQKVLQAAQQMGYRPNPMVGALMARLHSRKQQPRHSTLAWINTHISQKEWSVRPYRRHYLEGARARCEELGFGLDELWTEQPGMKAERFEKIIRSRGIYGLIIPHAVAPRFFPEIHWDDFSVVTITRPSFDAGWHCVDSDCFGNVMEAFSQALALGYKRPGLALQHVHAEQRPEWVACFTWRQRELPQSQQVPLFELPERFEDFEKPYSHWLRAEKPDVVFCCDSRLLELSQQIGLRVPEDLGLIHLHQAEDVAEWSGINERDEEIGAAAAGLVAACLIRNERGAVSVPRRSLVPGKWVEGKTTRRM